MSSQLSPPPGGDVNRGPGLTAIYCTECGIALMVVLARAWARISIRNVGKDDWCMFVTMALFIALTIVVSLFAASGGVRHAYYMSESKLLHVTKLGFIAQPIATIAQGLSKISVAFLLLRILGNVILPWRKVLLWLVIIITAILSIIQSFLTFYQCKNPEALWNPVVAKTTSCWNPIVQTNFAIFTSSWNVAMDFLLAFFPLTIVYGLQMSGHRKIAISVLLGLGMFSGICAAIKTAKLYALASRADPLWAEAELFVVIICGSIPTIKILYERYFTNKSPSQIYISFRNMVSRVSGRMAGSPGSSKNNTHISSKHPYSKHADEATFHLDDRTHGTDTMIVGHPAAKESWSDVESSRMADKEASTTINNIKVSQSFEVV
ncbi:MAG: hypothetical protein Q9195_007816 [Heterodermia aff. obscurata]